MKRRSFRLLPHTADIRLEVRGKDLPELFAESITAMLSLITDRRKVRARESRILVISERDPEEQLFLLLREALLLVSADRFLGRSACGTMKSSGVTVEIAGEPLDLSRHSLHREIKAVTGHAMAVEKRPGGYIARFVLDV
jgi:SHS2 domain-containing protein